MAGNQVTLTFAGDADSLTRAMGDVERESNGLERSLSDVESQARATARAAGTSEEAFEAAARQAGVMGERLDRASGASSMLSGGIGDIGGALTEAFGEDHPIGKLGEQMEKAGTIITGVTGALDLMILANTVAQASWVRTAASMVAARTAMIATSIATGVATAAQWLWNIAMTANPIGLIIVGVAALVAGIVWLATQTDFFAKAWKVIWDGIVAYVKWVVGNYQKAWELIVAGANWVIGIFKKIPGLIGSAFSTVYSIITAPFRAAFNAVANLWNGTIGRLSWTIPSWVPGVGGNSIRAPRLPTMHSGGTVPGAPGAQVLAVLQAGETIGSRSAAGGRAELVIRSDGTRLADALVQLIAGAVRDKGGRPQVLGLSGG
ncbi:MAG TPA: hypothetical protein VF092_16020 [Longimicrobium sp.]